MTVVRAQFMHTVTNYLIAHLALADLLVCTTLLAFQERFVQTRDYLQEPLLCLFFEKQTPAWFAVNLSIASMVFVTFERYIAIVHPLHYPRYLSRQRIKLATAGIWLLSAPLALIQMFLPNIAGKDGNCLEDLILTKATPWAIFAFEVVTYITPILSLLYCYGRIMMNLHHNARRHRQANNAGHAMDLLRAQRKVAIVLFMVASVYTIVWLTIFVTYLFLRFRYVPDLKYLVKHLYPVLFAFNAVVNPIIYAFKYKEIRRGVREAVLPRCLTRRRKIGATNVNIAMG